MNKEIKYLLEEMEDNTQDYVGTNGCLYQDLLREELNLLLDYISNLQNQVKKQKGVIDKVYKKCQSKKGNYDYDVFIKLNESWKTLSRFTEHIKYNLHPIITEAYTCDIKNSINEIIETTKYDVVFKKDILDILNEGKK